MNGLKSATLCLVAAIWIQGDEKDYRFGFTGTGGREFTEKFRLRYYAPVNDPSPDEAVVRGVAKLNVRLDGLGESEEQFHKRLNNYVLNLITWYLVPVGPKPGLTWYSPDVTALVNVERPLIKEAIEREKAAGDESLGSIWEIGNEPNLFPAITPQEYAALFAAYYEVIKAADPTAPVALGALYLPEAAQDLRPRLEEYIDNMLRAGLQEQGMLDAVQEAGIYTDLLQDLQGELFARILGLSGREYLAAVLDELPPEVSPDLISLHVYPYDDREPFQSEEERQTQIIEALGGIIGVLDERNIVVPLWVTEFGNTNPELSEVQAHSSEIKSAKKAHLGAL